ncbi:MAG: malonate-semialdehyde dehydrogenase (acetylating)/methylmalonate-semialdehyde dehydrogenase [Planctomycetota bacterium]|jgi:malonate-semialdehyde dehydrogenase (acetylating)/methylmalonate-semialdehyde dehydrogenase
MKRVPGQSRVDSISHKPREIEMSVERLQNYVGGEWIDSTSKTTGQVHNPATGELIGECPFSTTEELDHAVAVAKQAFDGWRRTPVEERIQPLFRLKTLLDANAKDMAAILTREHGKTLSEALGSVQRGIQMVEAATSAPSLMMGQALEDISRGIDCQSVRQPVGVFTCIAPFNFPAMVPLWFFPFAVACGNTFVCKPSEQVPFSQKFMWELVHESGFPPGVLNLVNGGHDVVNGMINNPDIDGISFVGSTPIAEYVYSKASAKLKRVQALGGAKNYIFLMADADMEFALDSITESAMGCAGERCLAASVVLCIGGNKDKVREGLIKRMKTLVVGDGSKPGVHLGPVISAEHKERVLAKIQKGIDEGGELVLDGRNPDVPGNGYFVGPTLFDNVKEGMSIAQEEIFGPVLCLMEVDTLEEALAIAKRQPLANANSIFTTSGKSARKFGYEVPASMAGINIGVAAPMSFFSFGGAKQSFFGDLKAHGREAFDFYTDRKVLISRW